MANRERVYDRKQEFSEDLGMGLGRGARNHLAIHNGSPLGVLSIPLVTGEMINVHGREATEQTMMLRVEGKHVWRLVIGEVYAVPNPHRIQRVYSLLQIHRHR